MQYRGHSREAGRSGKVDCRGECVQSTLLQPKQCYLNFTYWIWFIGTQHFVVLLSCVSQIRSDRTTLISQATLTVTPALGLTQQLPKSASLRWTSPLFLLEPFHFFISRISYKAWSLLIIPTIAAISITVEGEGKRMAGNVIAGKKCKGIWPRIISRLTRPLSRCTHAILIKLREVARIHHGAGMLQSPT